MNTHFQNNDRIDNVPLYKVLSHIASNQLTGVLTVSGDLVTFDYYFDNGAYAFAVPHSLSEHQSLGQLLITRGHCNEEQIKQLLENQKHKMLKIGRLALDENYLSETELLRMLEDQKMLYLFPGLTWKSGVYYFHNTETIHYDRHLYKPTHLDKIIRIGPDILKSWNWVQERLPEDVIPEKKSGFEIVPEGIRIRHSSKDQKVVVLTECQEALFEIIDGNLSVRNIIDSVHYFEWETRIALLDMQDTGLINVDNKKTLLNKKRKPKKGSEKQELNQFRSVLLGMTKLLSIAVFLVVTVMLVLERMNNYIILTDYYFDPAADVVTASRAGEIQSAVLLFHLFEDRFPVSLQELVDGLWIDKNILKDGYGSDFMYHSKNSSYALRSKGFDRSLNTDDDIVFSGHIRDFVFGSFYSALPDADHMNREQGE